ncbi:MAG: acyltransferase family protein, partial [Aquisalinus sp.]|nr:acyltransferase family protein [Aquisalinus sp.]
MPKPTSKRLHSLDAVRGGSLLLGIFFHAAFSFFPGDQFWLVVDTQRSEVVSGTAYVLHIFRMTIFFVLAGYFARMQTYRLGSGSFVRDRLKRIGIPLVVFWPIVMACFIALAIWGTIHANGGTMPENPPPPPPPMTLQNFPLTHLWFLYVLLIFYAVSLALRGLFSVIRVRGLIGKASDHILNRVSSAGVLPIVLALPTAATFISQPMWHPFFGIPAPDYGFVPNPIASVAYGTAFTVGWLLQRDAEHLRRAIRLRPLYLGAAVALTAYCISQIGLNVTYMQAIPEGGKTLYSIAYSLATWTWTFGLIGLCTKIWSKESAVRRYIADASYWLYLIHLPVVMALQIWVSQWTLAAEIKYGVILGLSIPFMLLTYELLVRYTFVGWILNGKKRSR